MTTQQSFPQLDSAITDENGNLSLTWFRFFIALWNRTGGAAGNNSASFNYPATAGNPNQVLTSEGAAKATVWTTLANKLSQFVNDAGFITVDALGGFSTPDSVQSQIKSSQFQQLSTTIPPANTANGAVGSSTHLARADHDHPFERNPVFGGTATALQFTLSVGPSWTAGNGAPSAAKPNGSLYSRADGTIGARLYVSNGTTWAAVAGV